MTLRGAFRPAPTVKDLLEEMTVEDSANEDSANIVGLALAAKPHGQALRAGGAGREKITPHQSQSIACP